MSAIDDGGPLFPTQVERQSIYGIPGVKPTKVVVPGASLRDYFAGEALKGLLSAGTSMDRDKIAAWCYAKADAMLLARKGSA